MNRDLLFWIIIIVIGLVFKLTDVLGIGVLVLGFSGLAANVLNLKHIMKNRGVQVTMSLIVSSLFFIILLGGALFIEGSPFSLSEVEIYIVALIALFVFYYRKGRRSDKK